MESKTDLQLLFANNKSNPYLNSEAFKVHSGNHGNRSVYFKRQSSFINGLFVNYSTIQR
jgi:hypothetical protein